MRGKEEVRKGSGSGATSLCDLRPVPLLRRMRDARSTRLLLGMSLAQMGEQLGQVHPNGHGQKPYAKQSVSQWENRGGRKRYRMTDYTREAYRIVVSETIAQATGGRVRVRARLGVRVWRFEAQASCVDCGKEFMMGRSNAKRCRRCRR
jgi:transcriptional regulator with XRE-family HTH domain